MREAPVQRQVALTLLSVRLKMRCGRMLKEKRLKGLTPQGLGLCAMRREQEIKVCILEN